MKHVEDVETGCKENVFRGVRIVPSTVWSWVGLIAAALIAFWATGKNEFHQFALGILVASVSLLVLLSFVELVWQVLEAMLGLAQWDTTDRSRERGP